MVKSWVSQLADDFERLIDLGVKEDCERSLIDLTAYLWDIVDPGEPLVTGWAMEAIAAHLEAAYHGHIKRLVITVPPGFSKSTLTNVMFPLWVWTKEPHSRFINASYEQGIPERDNLKCRNIINHENWQRFWGDKFKLAVPNTIQKFENDKTGWKMATAVGAKLIGYRGNYICIDDPNDPSIENQSGLKRKAAVRWLTEVVPTRLNKASRDRIILIQQRLHLEDCAGTALALEHENFVHLNIPMEYEPRLYINAYVPSDEEESGERIETLFDTEAQAALKVDPDCVFWRDPREHPGELAWVERFGGLDVAKMKKTLGPIASAAQLQQRPVRRGGNVVKEEDWQIWKGQREDGRLDYPPFTFILATLDTAYTDDDANDPCGACYWGLWPDDYGNPRVMLIWAWTEWLEFNDCVRRMLHTCSRDNVNHGDDLQGLPRFPVDKLVIEGKASGISTQQELVRLMTIGQAKKFGVDLLPAKLLRDDKLSRLVSISHMFANKMIWTPDLEWSDKVIHQVCNFPFAGHDEYADCTSMALRWLRDQGFAPTREQVFEDAQAEMAFKPRPPPLYGGIG